MNTDKEKEDKEIKRASTKRPSCKEAIYSYFGGKEMYKSLLGLKDGRANMTPLDYALLSTLY